MWEVYVGGGGSVDTHFTNSYLECQSPTTLGRGMFPPRATMSIIFHKLACSYACKTHDSEGGLQLAQGVPI